MKNLFQAFLYKLTKDLTFRITLIIGIALAVFETLIFLLIDYGLDVAEEEVGMTFKILTGPTMLTMTLSPVQNYGIAVPINLISFICLEFSQGSIRNKIIAGHSKKEIYLSLFLSGLVFALSLITVYVGLCTAFGCIFGGFDLSEPVFGLAGTGYIDAEYIWKTILIALLAYVCIVSFSVFFATLFRSIGPCIPIVIITLMGLYLGGTIVASIGEAFDNEALVMVTKILNPLYALGGGADTEIVMVNDVPNGMRTYYATDTFICAVANNIVYTGLFLFFGAFIFSKRDVK